MSTLYEWRRRLAKRKRRSRRFAEVAVVERPAAVADVELELPSGVKVRVPLGFDPSHLRQVLGALTGEC